MTEAELRDRGAYWQKVLRLQDWLVIPKVVRSWDLDNESGAGQCDALLPHRIAEIRLLDPCDYTGRQWVPMDLERVLVHELLHIHFESLWPKRRNTSCNIAEEQVINALADALIELDRKKHARAEGESPERG